MAKYRKKPVVIEAREMGVDAEPEELNALKDWCGGVAAMHDGRPAIIIPTLEGDHRAEPGDWIIRGVAGEFYPCKPDIFKATYERAD